MRIISFIISCVLILSATIASAQTFNFSHNSVTRSYIVHLPTNYSDSNIYPLVINMHGYGSDGTQQQFYAEMDAVADTANFIVVYPFGTGSTLSWNSGQNWSYSPGINDVTFISALIDTMIMNYSVDPLKVYACGMSNGGFMSYRLACELNNKIAAIGSVTGVMSDSIYNSCQTYRPVPILHMHGTSDPTVAYNGTPGNTAVETGIDWWVQNNNCPTTPVTTNLPDINMTDASTVTTYFYGPCDDSTEVLLYKITGGEHTWPGVTFNIGITNQDIEGSGEIWLFFRKHNIPFALNTTGSINSGICDGIATATVTGSTGPYNYSWNTSPVQTTAIATGLCSGSYTVIVSDVNGDSTDASAFVEQGVVGIAELNPVKKVVVYPNPFNGVITLKNIPKDISNIELYDLLGKSVATFGSSNQKNELQLNLSDIKRGSFLLHIESHGNTQHFLIIKQ